jgi:hypothetical protein
VHSFLGGLRVCHLAVIYAQAMQYDEYSYCVIEKYRDDGADKAATQKRLLPGKGR